MMMLSTRSRSTTALVVCVVFVLIVLYQLHRPLSVSPGGGENAPPPPEQQQATDNSSSSSSSSSPAAVDPYWITAHKRPKFAYVQYATDRDYLCNALINFARLRRFGAKEDRVLIFPKNWLDGDQDSAEKTAVWHLHEQYPDIILHPSDVLSTEKGDETWSNSLTKLHAFGLVDYDRVLAFDSDSLVLNSMDHFFNAPMATVAFPRAYWLTSTEPNDVGKQMLGSHVMLIAPSQSLYGRIISDAVESGDFDMEIVNRLFSTSAMILPHRRLALLTGEFRNTDHAKYLAPDVDEKWDPVKEVSTAFLVHFSDWPLPKPWNERTPEEWEAALPLCQGDDCSDREVWTSFYEEYDTDKAGLCKALV